jgi:hypothetical protein
MNKKFMYQVGNNKKVILWCTVNQVLKILIDILINVICVNEQEIYVSIGNNKKVILWCTVNQISKILIDILIIPFFDLNIYPENLMGKIP